MLGGLAVLCSVSTANAQPGKGPGGFQPPQPGEILTGFLQDLLKLNADQKKQLGELQKEVDSKLAKILTAEQKKSLDAMSPGKGGFGKGFGPPAGGPGGTPPGGTPGGPPPKMGFGGPGFPGFGGFGVGSADVQKKIAATDEEWKVIGPKMQKVAVARRAISGEVSAGAGTAVAQAQAELKTVLDEPKHTKAEVDQKITAVRTARERARADLVEAQRDLMRLLTPTQQAVMVSLGYLE
jgi:Spy/CpxP family protein refolding chaperone